MVLQFQACENQGLLQSAYFLRRDLSFLRDREPRLRGELEIVQEPAKTFTFTTKIWMPKNWIVEKWNGHEFESIPTVIDDDSFATASAAHKFRVRPPGDLIPVSATKDDFFPSSWFESLAGIL